MRTSRVIALVLGLRLGLLQGAPGQSSLALEVDRALESAGPAGETFDAATLYRLQAIVRQARSPEELRAIESRLDAALESNAPWAAQQEVCRVLWMVGTAQSAPALTKLLAQPDTAGMACYAIANNPAPELGQAVRDALPGSQGAVATSLLNLLGERRDAAATDRILPFLRSSDPLVAGAAATALGKIGGSGAVAALDAFRQASTPDRRWAADEAYLRALETTEPPGAVPRWRELVGAKTESALVRRAALVRLSEHAPDAALPWLLAALRDEEPSLKPAAGQALRSLRDTAAAQPVTARLTELPSASRAMAVEALGPTLSAHALAAFLPDPAARGSALRALGARPDADAAAALLAAALADPAPADRPELFRLLRNLPGQAATDALLRAFPAAPPHCLVDLCKVLAARGATVPLTPLLERAHTGETEVRVQAVRALRYAATADDRAALFDLLASADGPDLHAAVEETIAELLARSNQSEAQTDWLLARLASAPRPQDRESLLRLLARAGTPAALRGVVEHTSAGSAGEREAAVRVLAQWPNADALDPLLGLARAGSSATQRLLALRGAARLLGESALNAAAKADRYRELMDTAGDPASRKLLLAGLAQTPAAAAFDVIRPCLSDPAVRAEAALAALTVAGNLGPADDAAVNAALGRVLAAVSDPGVREQAQARLRPARPPPPDVFLEALTPIRALSGNEGGKGSPQLGRNCIGQPLKLKGVTYAHGVGEHAPADLTYNLMPAARRFVCVVGLDDQVARFNDVRGSIVVKVFADDRWLAITPVLRGGGAAANVDVALPAGARTLRLVVEDAGDGVDFDDADFVDAGFLTGERR